MVRREFGVDRGGVGGWWAVRRVGEGAAWEDDGESFLAGEVEPWISGKIVALGAYFGEQVEGIVERLLGEQMADGGWDCEQENGSTRGALHSTIDVLDGPLEDERATGGSPVVAPAPRRRHAEPLELRRAAQQ